MNGIINIRKEKGFTSHDVVNIVRRITKCKAGHTGTLDPNATGVLPVCLGRATKIADYIMGHDKEYLAQIIFGSATDTQDATGNIIADAQSNVNLTEFENAIQHFVGKILQTPPMYSAIKVGGKKLYEYARQGVEVEVKPREVVIHEIKIESTHLPQFAAIRVRCSKGTYIRTLCVDLGEKLDTYAHMGELVRTKSGRFCLEDSISLAQLEKIAIEGRLDSVVMPIESVLNYMPKIFISADAQKWLSNGNKIPLAFVTGLATPHAPEYLAFDAAGKLAGIFIANNDCIKPKTMLYT